MDDLEFESAPPPPRPKTTTVIGLLAAVAGVFSYLLTYAMANALVAAEILKPFKADHDPRPLWFAICFAVLITLFAALATAARVSAGRHIRQIEQMEQEA